MPQRCVPTQPITPPIPDIPELSDIGEFPFDITPNLLQETAEVFDGASKIFKHGMDFMDRFDNDEHANKHRQNLFYPFASKDEWELASFLLQCGLSTTLIDELLCLNLVSIL